MNETAPVLALGGGFSDEPSHSKHLRKAAWLQKHFNETTIKKKREETEKSSYFFCTFMTKFPVTSPRPGYALLFFLLFSYAHSYLLCFVKAVSELLC